MKKYQPSDIFTHIKTDSNMVTIFETMVIYHKHK